MTAKLETPAAAVAGYLQSLGVTYCANLVGAMVRDGWRCDGWRVVFTRSGSWRNLETDYYTGTGHRRKTPRGWPDRQPVPVAPAAAGVLHSLLLDGEALALPFHEWCETLGYEEDSRRALATYDACVTSGRALAAFFTPGELTQLRALLEDF